MQTLTLKEAIARLQAGGLVAFATETVYGLGADASQDAAVAAIYTVKNRPSFNPLIVHVSDRTQAQRLGVWNDRAEALADVFWPGPLTLVLPKRTSARLSPIVSAGSATLALRCPQPEQARALAAALPSGIAAPSANKSGALSPTRQAHVQEAFGEDTRITLLPGSRPTVGLESTVIDLAGPQPLILRKGAVTSTQLAEIVGPLRDHEASLQDFSDEQVSSPGQLRRHYAPRIPLLLNQITAGPGQALLAFGRPIPTAEWIFNLSERGDVVEAATRLFEGLHVLSGSGARAICAMPIPKHGIGLAINDRLTRGAVPLA